MQRETTLVIILQKMERKSKTFNPKLKKQYFKQLCFYFCTILLMVELKGANDAYTASGNNHRSRLVPIPMHNGHVSN